MELKILVFVQVLSNGWNVSQTMYVLLTVWVGFISRIGRTRTLRPGNGVWEIPWSLSEWASCTSDCFLCIT